MESFDTFVDIVMPVLTKVLPVSGVEYIELRRVCRNRPPDEYVVEEERTDPIRVICRCNQFFRLSTTGVSTLSYKYRLII